MRSIDIHAHLMPQCLWRAFATGDARYGIRYAPGDGLGVAVHPEPRIAITPKLRFTPEKRLQDMDEQGVDVQVISIHTPFFSYHLDAAQGRQLAREVRCQKHAPTHRSRPCSLLPPLGGDHGPPRRRPG